MKTVKKILSLVLVLIVCLGTLPMTDLGIEASAASEEYALFPMNVLYVVRTNTKLDADQKEYAMPDGGHVKYAFDLSGSDTKVKAPFTGKVLFVDKGNEHAVFFQSLNKVKLANGKTDYLTCVFVHDDDVSNIKVGKVYNQGEYIYDQGTFGEGVKGKYNRHLHLEVAIGKLDISTKYSVWTNLSKVRNSKNGIQVHQALFLKSNVKRDKDYIKVACQNNKIIKLDWKTLSQITFNANGGTISTSKQYFEVGKTHGSLPSPTRSGYKFNGWYTKQTGGDKVTADSKVTKGNKTLYAHWTVADADKIYSIRYYATDAYGKDMGTTEVLFGEKFTLKANEFYRAGLVFKGWNVKRKSDEKWYVSGKGWQTEKSISKNKYKKKLYTDKSTLTLNSAWTKGGPKNDMFVFYAVFEECASHKWDNGKITTAATTVKKGVRTYTCTDCGLSKTETIPVSTTEKYFSKTYANSITANNAKIGGDAKSTAKKTGTGFYLGTSKDSMKRYTKNLKGKSDPAGTYTSMFFTLSDWYGKLQPGTTYYYSVFYTDSKSNECASVIKSFKTTGTSSTTTTKNVYTFAYNSNGGTGSISNQTVEKGKDFTVKSNDFTRSGYSFKGYTVQRKSDGKWFVPNEGWNAESDIIKNKWSKKIYSVGIKLNVNSSWQNGSKNDETFTFFAVWESKGCTSHKWDSGKVTKAATTVKTGIKTYTCTICSKTKTETIPISTTEKYFSKTYANNITANNAKIGGNANSTAKKKGTGFYLGTSKDSMKRYTKNLKGKSDAAGTYTSIFFTMSDWYGKLKPGTTYYYSIFYIDNKGNECASVIKSFKTK